LIRVAFDSLGQKQRVFEPYCLSLSSMVAADIPQNLGPNNHKNWGQAPFLPFFPQVENVYLLTKMGPGPNFLE
jgi:hypothetical protein